MRDSTGFRVLSASLLLLGLVAGCDEDAGGGGTGGGGDGGASASSASGPGATTGNGSQSGPSSGNTSGNGGNGGNAQSSGAVTNGVGPGTAASNSAAGAGGGEVDPCEGVDPDSIYAQTAVDFTTFQTVNLCAYQGQVVMIVNIAASCGYTPQMSGLQLLENTFSAEGFHVLGFLSDDFDQAGSQADIEACNAAHGVTFQEYGVAAVTDDPQPAFAWIQAQTNPGPAGEPMAPIWNFNKYIVSRSGELVGHYTQTEYWGTDAAAPEFEASLAVQKIREQLAAD